MSEDSIKTTETLGAKLPAWGSLQILEEIGRGSFGVVYRAWEPALAREVALKVIRPSDEHGPETIASILREGQLLARVHHPNVVTVHGAMQIGDEVGLWMEFVKGRSLSELVKRDGPRAPAEAAVIGISLCQALAAVHQAGVIHRDIKAQNVMRESGGRIVLMDFGAGQVLDDPRRPHEIVGTPVYMAPEVLAGGKATARSDVYSLGVLLYYLVSGAYPVDANTWTDLLRAHARFERRPLGDVRPDAPVRFVRVVERATALKPDDRYATSGGMLADLTAAVAGRIAAGQRRTPRTDSRRRRPVEPTVAARVWPIAIGGAGVVLGIWVLGTITSVAFNHTLGRWDYSTESIWSWWIWGLRALIPGAVQATIVVLLLALMAAVWRLVKRLSAPVARIGNDLTSRRQSIAVRSGLDDPDVAAQALLAAQILAVAVFCWYFRDIFVAVNAFVDTASAQDVEPLRPERLEYHQLYNFSMAMLILAMSAGAYHIIRMRRRSNRPVRSSSMFAISAVIGVSLVLLVLPYRLIWHNLFEVASSGGLRCYVLGEAGVSALVYCPDDAVPRVRTVAVDALDRTGQRQSLYTR